MNIPAVWVVLVLDLLMTAAVLIPLWFAMHWLQRRVEGCWLGRHGYTREEFLRMLGVMEDEMDGIRARHKASPQCGEPGYTHCPDCGADRAVPHLADCPHVTSCQRWSAHGVEAQEKCPHCGHYGLNHLLDGCAACTD